VRLRLAALVLIAALASAGCGNSEDGGEAARHVDPRSDAVLALDLDYDGGNWQQLKRLHARAIQVARDRSRRLHAADARRRARRGGLGGRAVVRR
jgi:hypothetical protein